MKIQIQIVRERTCCKERARLKAERHLKHKDCLDAFHWSFRGEHGVRALYPPNTKLGYRSITLTECELTIPRHPAAPL